ncbi:MAG: hypothetical protein HQL52_16425 [Magnetococcales bacterium]|nr:hypothetical protein [Magnetococcales bacterium]
MKNIFALLVALGVGWGTTPVYADDKPAMDKPAVDKPGDISKKPRINKILTKNFNETDKDGNGEVTYAEFEERALLNLKKRFEKMDQDQNGTLTLEEIDTHNREKRKAKKNNRMKIRAKPNKAEE